MSLKQLACILASSLIRVGLDDIYILHGIYTNIPKSVVGYLDELKELIHGYLWIITKRYPDWSEKDAPATQMAPSLLKRSEQESFGTKQYKLLPWFLPPLTNRRRAAPISWAHQIDIHPCSTKERRGRADNGKLSLGMCTRMGGGSSFQMEQVALRKLVLS